MSQRSSPSFEFDDDDFPTLSSQKSPASSQFSLQPQNPPPPQTLEDAFSHLSVSSSSFNHPPFDFIAHGPSRVNAPSKIPSCNGWGNGVLNYHSSNLWDPTFTANGHSDDNGFIDSEPFLNQRENHTFGGPFSTVPLPNGTQQRTPDVVPLSNGVQQRIPGVVSLSNGMRQKTPDIVPLSNGTQQRTRDGDFLSGNGSNITGFSVEERRVRWFNALRWRVLLLAKDQHQCRILQETLKMLTSEEFNTIFLELINHVAELIIDPFGNYVVQRMVEICSEEQRTRIVLMVTHCNFQLVRICLSPHGTRAVEKLLEHVTTQEQRAHIISALYPGAAVLAKDVNGHRVLLHCLKHFSGEENKYLLNVVTNKCIWIATDKTGCCVLQQCINHARGGTKRNLIDAIIVNASVLAEDCYGNYVLQHLLSLKIPGVVEELLTQLEGKFFYLACNKYGSNVVEKFFQDSSELHSTVIILELLCNPNVVMLLVDPYGNYVIKSALSVSKGGVRNALERLIKLNSVAMQSNLYGKKLLAWFEKGKI